MTSDQQSKVDKAFAVQKQNRRTASQNLLTLVKPNRKDEV